MFTATAKFNMRYGAIEEAKLPARPNQPPRPVPERVGEPSVFKHVLYIIKENRTYDQVLGDMKEGNGNAALCTFGEKFTPNQHKLAREFILLDNTYCSGIQSADGHQWTDSAITTDYVERGHAGFPRSYMSMKTEDGMDALAYSPAGFLWDNALKHKVSIRDYGEGCFSDCGWADKKRKDKITWKDYLADLGSGVNQTAIRCKPGIASLKGIAKLDTVGWDLNVPDVVRADRFIAELQQFEREGTMPQLMIMLLPTITPQARRRKSLRQPP
jgi:phospholipase C